MSRSSPSWVRAMVAADTWVVPTMVSWETAFFNDRSSADVLSARPEVRYMPPETVDRWQRAVEERLNATSVETNRRVAQLRRQVLQALHQGGANIVLGTDSPQIFSVPGFAVHHEMAQYVDVGMTPYEVLETGTKKPAEYFNATDEFGVVAVGRRADLILLHRQPTGRHRQRGRSRWGHGQRALVPRGGDPAPARGDCAALWQLSDKWSVLVSREARFGPRRLSGKARRGSLLGICDRGVTKPGGMPRSKIALGVARTLH